MSRPPAHAGWLSARYVLLSQPANHNYLGVIVIQISEVKKVKEGEYKITSLPCPSCDKTLTLAITGEQLFLINQNALIQVALPDVSPDDRERFISGYCSKCWNKMFGL